MNLQERIEELQHESEESGRRWHESQKKIDRYMRILTVSLIIFAVASVAAAIGHIMLLILSLQH